jgi:hypothetical protein
MPSDAQYTVTFVPPKRGSDGRITVERVGGAPQSRPATIPGILWALDYAEIAKRKGFTVDCSQLRRVLESNPMTVAYAKPKGGTEGTVSVEWGKAAMVAAADAEGIGWARGLASQARGYALPVNDLALAKARAK